jgi:ATP-dependent 26S proteasome regulatory subunit
MFNRAGSCAPSPIVLEDIDRAFPKQQSSGARSAISQQQLLNCLDGFTTQDGVVVVATANEPTALGPAILRRPGRFDRVVLFPNPTAELRLRYLRRLNNQQKQSELQAAIDLSEGFSFAQLREAYILAGQMAYEREAEIEPGDILRAVQALRNGYAMVKQRRDAAGFEPMRNLGLESCNLLPS